MAFLQVGAAFPDSRCVVASDLNRRSGWVSVSQQLVSCGLDVVHLLLSELQLSHQTLPAQKNRQSPSCCRRHNHERRAWKLFYRVVVFLRGHVAVSFAPVVVDLLLLLVVEPHQLLGGCVDEGVKLVQVLQPDLGGVLVRECAKDVFAGASFSTHSRLFLSLFFATHQQFVVLQLQLS